MDELQDAGRIHFVTHSMGGYPGASLSEAPQTSQPWPGGDAGPPNHGSEIVDRFGQTWWFRLINGPAGSELSTDEQALPSTLGPADYPVGIIAGDRSLDPCSLCLPRPNDGQGNCAVSPTGRHDRFSVVHMGIPF